MLNDTKISRRTVLKLGGGILAAAPFVHTPSRALANVGEPLQVSYATRKSLGRAMANDVPIRERASIKAALVRNLKWNELIPLLSELRAAGPSAHNDIWYHTTDGYVHSALIYPCENVANTPLTTMPEQGVWAEITVPTTEARSKPDDKAPVRDRFVYGMVFRVLAVMADSKGTPWYQLSDEFAGSGFYTRAEHVRPIPDEEFLPLSPEVPQEQKRIEVDLKAQVVTAYEYDKPVFSTRVATGGKYKQPDGSVADYFTNPGDHRVFRKIAGQRMFGGTAGFDYYNLPGVPWVSYFTNSGIAFHGSYWHNDYGRPRSHGCVNMYPDDARWVFRWTMPVVQPTDKMVRLADRKQGSWVKVF
jgi:lipoprotein-anchoring transpeptidase ErfK/SrfK